MLQETLPTGRYDRLARASDGFGAGAYTHRARAVLAGLLLDAERTDPARAPRPHLRHLLLGGACDDLSVYGTRQRFRRARVARATAFTADAAAEYSLTRSWVLALDVVYQRNASTTVSGSVPGGMPAAAGSAPGASPFQSVSGSSWSIGFAPAVEYNFSSRVGALLGVANHRDRSQYHGERDAGRGRSIWFSEERRAGLGCGNGALAGLNGR